MAAEEVKWEWEATGGKWQRYSAPDEEKLEAAYQKDKSAVVSLSKLHSVHLDKMQHIRTGDSRIKNVRRVAPTSSSDTSTTTTTSSASASSEKSSGDSGASEQKEKKDKASEEDEQPPEKKRKLDESSAVPSSAKSSEEKSPAAEPNYIAPQQLRMPSNAAARRLQNDMRSLSKGDRKTQGYEASFVGDNIFEWEVRIYEVDADSSLGKDLKKYQQLHGLDHIKLRFSFPDSYPLKPPFVYIYQPQCFGGYISSVALCIDVLMNHWAASITAETLLLQIRQLFMEGGVRIRMDTTEPYDEATARRQFKQLARCHRSEDSW